MLQGVCVCVENTENTENNKKFTSKYMDMYQNGTRTFHLPPPFGSDLKLIGVDVEGSSAGITDTDDPGPADEVTDVDDCVTGMVQVDDCLAGGADKDADVGG